MRSAQISRHLHNNAEHKVTAAELYRHRRGLRILIVVLIPLGIWTLVGLVVMWPGNVADHVNADAAGYSASGVSYPHAKITAVEEITCDGLPGSTPGQSGNACANLTVTVSDGEGKGEVASVPLTHALYASGAEVGQSVVLIRVPPGDGQPGSYQFSDFDRRTPLIVLSTVFAVVVVAVARWRGLASLLGPAFAGFILVKFMFPALVAGQNPVVVGLIGSSAIMFVVLYAAHGFNARTTTALVGTLFGLVLIATLGYLATRWAHLTGVASEDDYVLAASTPDLQLTSVVICGIIVAGLGVLNDVTITQGVGGLGARRRPLPRRARHRAAAAQPRPVRPGHAHRPRPHRLDRLHDRLRHRGRLAVGAAADRGLQPAAAAGPTDRTVLRRDRPHARRLDRPRPRRPADHGDRRGRRPRRPRPAG